MSLIRTLMLASTVMLGGCMTLLPPIESEPVTCPVEKLPPVNLALRDEAYTYNDQERLQWMIKTMKSHSFVSGADYWADNYPIRIAFTDVQKNPEPFEWKDFPAMMVRVFVPMVMPIPARDKGSYRVRVFYQHAEVFTRSYDYDYRYKTFLWYAPSYSMPPKPVLDDFAKRLLRDICGSIVVKPTDSHSLPGSI
jgi:hypothetical protein